MYSDKEYHESQKMDANNNFLEGLATCHSITYVHGRLIGDPLDIEMF